MKLDDLILSAFPSLDGEDNEKAREGMEAEAERFLRSGLPWEMWKRLSRESQDTFVKVNDRLWTERMVVLSMLIKGESVETLKSAEKPEDDSTFRVLRSHTERAYQRTA